jgi:hypothetical protein
MEYSYEMKQQLANEIEKLRKKKYLINILKIIKMKNPDIEITENKNGIFIFFNDLTNETYNDLKTYIIQLKEKKEKTLDSVDSNVFLTASETETNTKLKYSNREKSLIKKKLYDNVVSTQNEDAKKYKKKLI